MYLRVNNQWIENKNSNEDQLKFWNRLLSSKNFSSGRRWINKGCKIGSDFLRTNKYLLN